MILKSYSHKGLFDNLPSAFQPYWILFWDKSIQTSMIVSSLMPYAGPLIKLLFKRGCCCCKRKSYKANTHLNPEFPLVRKYASILNIIFISCTYGFCIPPIVLFGAIVIVL